MLRDKSVKYDIEGSVWKGQRLGGADMFFIQVRIPENSGIRVDPDVPSDAATQLKTSLVSLT